MGPTLLVPEDLAEELQADELVEVYQPPSREEGSSSYLDLAGVASGGANVLIVLNASGHVVTLTATALKVVDFAKAILRWRAKRHEQSGPELLALSPQGQLKLDMTNPPPEDELIEYLKAIFPNIPPSASA